jgi:uncharacterized protein (DUF1501 family)
MQRRDFLIRTLQAGAVLPLASSGLFARPLGSNFFARPAALGDRVLVLINLSGGNDGLNTVVPFNDSAYYNARKTLSLKKTDTLKITDDLGLHTSMPEMLSLFNAGECAIVQSVGYPNQDRSHFRSTDIWNSASNADQMLYTGWLGRYLEKVHPEYPTTLPTSPFAIQISSSVSLALQSEQGNMGIAIDNPDRFYNLASGLKVAPEPLPNTLAGPELEYVRAVIEQSNTYSKGIQNAMQDGSNNATYDADSFSSQLKVVARLINGGLASGIYVVSLGGFDTHQGQLTRHAQLLSQLSRGVNNFLADVAAAGNGDRVACITFSEFGRRLNENGSAGTDHGAASVQFAFGKTVLGGKVLGGAPNLTDLDSRGDIKFVNDFRQIYSSVLQDWLGFSKSDAATALGGDYTKLPLFTALASGVRDAATASGMRLEQNVPNPATRSTAIAFALADRGYARIELRAADGTLVGTPLDRAVDAGVHRVQLDLSNLAAGNYLYTLQSGGRQVSKWMSVIK